MSRLRYLAIGLLGLSFLAQAQTTVIVEENGPAENRVDIVILGDGYTAEQIGDFAVDAAALAERFLSEAPFDEYRSYFNVRRIEVISNESGADHPERAISRTPGSSTHRPAHQQSLDQRYRLRDLTRTA